MPGKFKEIQCPFCGRIVRNTDKFCIFCGSKLEGGSHTSKKDQISEDTQKELDEELRESREEHEKAKNKKSKKENRKKKEKEEDAIKEMPTEIKEQLEAKMELAVLNNKKERLRDKLKSLTDELDSSRYEYDIDYAKKINLKLNAVKQIKKELFEQEEELRSKLGPSGQFRMDELETTMEVQREQLIELKRAYKRHKIKKNVYSQLKDEYAEIFRKAEEELQDLRSNVIHWLSQERANKNRLENQIRILKARLKAGEIEEKDYNSELQRLEKEIEDIDQKTKILELYSEPKKRSFFK